MEQARRWLKFIATKGPLVIASLALVVMMMVVVYHVIGRNFFSAPLFGAIEIIGLCGVALIGFALGYTELERGHIVIEVLLVRLPAAIRLPFTIFSLLMSLIAVAMIIWGGAIYAWEAVVRPGSLTMVLHLPSAPFKFIWVAGCIVFWFYLAYHFIEALLKVRKK